MNIQYDYNSPVIITYLILSIIAWFLNIITRGKSNKLLFTNYRSSPLNPFTYIRLFTHSIGHKDWDHLASNFLYISFFEGLTVVLRTYLENSSISSFFN